MFETPSSLKPMKELSSDHLTKSPSGLPINSSYETSQTLRETFPVDTLSSSNCLVQVDDLNNGFVYKIEQNILHSK